MIFSSYVFIFAFLPVMLFGFYLLKYLEFHKSSKLFLVAGSLFFYGFWNIAYLPILLGSIGVNFIIARGILSTNCVNRLGGVRAF